MNDDLLIEAIYLFNKHFNQEGKSDLPENIEVAVLRILAANNYISYDNNFIITKVNYQNLEKFKNQINEEALPENIKNISPVSFFDNITDIEYEIYSRSNYSVSFKNGLKLAELINFNDLKILDIGGNSGGLASAIASKYLTSHITVVDTKIPCEIGSEYKEVNNLNNINFICDDLFTFNLEKYDYIILSNIFHDYNDKDVRRILKNINTHLDDNTKVIILEDILDNEIGPIDVVMHGLRLSINTFYGKQRTINELNILISEIGLNLLNKEKINQVQSIVVYTL
ncbi:MAG: methyltransferase [Bacilli bacterium]|nr:methyltransferase [Bacilli bacterium]